MSLSFTEYGTGGKHLTMEALLELAKEGDLVARAEESGSEGCYIEVIRWKHGDDCHTGEWRRYCFEKVFGGEHPSEKDDARVSARATAGKYVKEINDVFGNGFVSVFHKFPTWSE